MHITNRTALLPATLLATAALALPATALAKGGGGSSTPPPAPDPAIVQCDYRLDGSTPEGSVFSNQAGEAGCISVINSGTSLRLYALALTPGWTADVKSSGGSSGGVRVLFTRTATGDRVEARIEPGKTVIK